MIMMDYIYLVRNESLIIKNSPICNIDFFLRKKERIPGKTLLKQNAGAIPDLLTEQEIGYYSCNFNDSDTLRPKP